MREAMRLLESDGLVSVLRGPQGGAVVTDRTAATVSRAMHLNLLATRTSTREVYEALREVEPVAARMAAERHPGKASRALFAHIAQHRAIIDDVERYAIGLRDFRRVMVEQCGNWPLILMTMPFYDVMTAQMPLHARLWMQRAKGDDLTNLPRTRAIDWHQSLAESIASGDGDKAEAEWRRFLKRIGERVYDVIGRDQPVR
jgi:DNA-binding FadR family transcriptional regulator